MNTNIIIAVIVVINILMSLCIIRLNNKVFILSKAVITLTLITPQGKVLINLQEAVQKGDKEETKRMIEELTKLDDHIRVNMDEVDRLCRRGNRG